MHINLKIGRNCTLNMFMITLKVMHSYKIYPIHCYQNQCGLKPSGRVKLGIFKYRTEKIEIGRGRERE